MAKPFETMPNVMDRTATNLGNAVTRIIRSAATVAGKTIVEATRVDTGRARSNWVASIGSPFTGIVPPYAPGTKLGIGESGNAAGAINQQAGVIRGFDSTKHNAIHITNNVPYIGALNNGGPTVGPDMMVQRGVAAARADVAGKKVLRRTA